MSDTLETMATKYRKTFGSPWGAEVLQDIAEKGRANATTFDPDPITHAFNAGLRALWLHINTFLNFSPADIWQITQGNRPITLPDAFPSVQDILDRNV